MKTPHFTVVTPCYRTATCIPELYRRLVAVFAELEATFELIFVDDGSPQNDWQQIVALAQQDSRIQGLQLSRNCGQHFAIQAGLRQATGDWVVVMDCDLQDSPEAIPRLYQTAMQGFDVVQARRVSRQDNWLRRKVSLWYCRLLSLLSERTTESGVANFCIMKCQVARAISQFCERNQNVPMFLELVGFSKRVVDVQHCSRFHGQSAYSLTRLYRLGLGVLVAHSNLPLRLSIQFGLFLSVTSLAFGLFTLARYFFLSSVPAGWTTLALLLCFLGGLGFANLGIIGLYLGMVFDEVKRRPLYVIRRTVGPAQTAAQQCISSGESM
jgi:glycosyltransferase involved in cell wall biosynthesis